MTQALGVSPDATSPDGREFDEAGDGANQRARTTRSVHRTEKAGNTVMYSLILTGDLLRRGVAVIVPQLVADLGQQLLVAELDARVERVVADDAPVARRHRDAAAARVVR